MRGEESSMVRLLFGPGSLCLYFSPQPLTFKHHLQRATRNGSCAGQSRVLGHLGAIMSAVRVYFRRPCAFILLGICLTHSFADLTVTAILCAALCLSSAQRPRHPVFGLLPASTCVCVEVLVCVLQTVVVPPRLRVLVI